MATFVLENLGLTDLPPTWVKKFHLQLGQYFTVYITSKETSASIPITQPISHQQERIALMQEIEKQLRGTGSEDSAEWIKLIKQTRTFSKPQLIF